MGKKQEIDTHFWTMKSPNIDKIIINRNNNDLTLYIDDSARINLIEIRGDGKGQVSIEIINRTIYQIGHNPFYKDTEIKETPV